MAAIKSWACEPNVYFCFTVMRKRAIEVALGAAVLLAAIYALRQYGPDGWLPACAFHTLTGLNCPCCGMTRATVAALHGHLGNAFRLNPLGMLLLPPAMLGLGLELIGWVRGKPLPWRMHLGTRTGWCLLVTVITFGVLRNLPWWPFTLLAPA